jgi:glycosyltransferase involved in cell wall biosynthesis
MRLVQDSELRREMGEAGRKLVAGKFDLKTNVAQLIALYNL